jgi:GNAT superfamily N-acetyltransferase
METFSGRQAMSIELIPYDLENKIEAQEIVDIVHEYYPRSAWPLTLEKVMTKGVVYFRAIYNGEQIGITGYSLKTPTLAETVKTTVFKDYRGKKLGASLSVAIEEKCRSIGVKKVMTTIYFFNHVMVQIKLKQGYIIEGYHPDHEAPGFHEYSLGKILA